MQTEEGLVNEGGVELPEDDVKRAENDLSCRLHTGRRWGEGREGVDIDIAMYPSFKSCRYPSSPWHPCW